MKDILTKFATEPKSAGTNIDPSPDPIPGGGDDLQGNILNIINVIIGILGVVAVVVIIFGGVQYMTSAGDSSKVKKAKDTILYGVIGLIVCILAAAIVNFVIRSIVGA